MATDFSKFDFNDCFIRTLDDITVFDLTVLQTIYSTDYPKESIQEDTIVYFENEKRKVDPEIVWQSLKQLASHNLITEKFNRVGVYGDGTPHLEPLHYVKNSLGVDFLRLYPCSRPKQGEINKSKKV